MAKYLVEGFIRVKIEVEADSEDEALEMAEENFMFDKHVDEDVIPTFETANAVEPDEDEEDAPLRTSKASYNDNEEED